MIWHDSQHHKPVLYIDQKEGLFSKIKILSIFIFPGNFGIEIDSWSNLLCYYFKWLIIEQPKIQLKTNSDPNVIKF